MAKKESKSDTAGGLVLVGIGVVSGILIGKGFFEPNGVPRKTSKKVSTGGKK